MRGGGGGGGGALLKLHWVDFIPYHCVHEDGSFLPQPVPYNPQCVKTDFHF